MAIISFDKDTLIDYVPGYGGNRESENPCVVTLKYVPYARVQHYSKILSTKTSGIRDNADIIEAGHAVQAKQFTDSVDKISNFFIDSREVTGANEFYECADTELILEIIKAMENSQKLSEGQLKN